MALKFTNQVFLDVTLDEQTTEVASEELEITMIDVDVTTKAEPLLWGSGYLTYTVNIKNNETEEITEVTFRSTLNTTYTVLVEDSVKIGDDPVEDYDYDPLTGLLTFAMDNIPLEGAVVVTFQVDKK